jgi:hypothetical protein
LRLLILSLAATISLSTTSFGASCSLPKPEVWIDGAYQKVALTNPCGFSIAVRFQSISKKGKRTSHSLYSTKCGGKSPTVLLGKSDEIGSFRLDYKDTGEVCGTRRKAATKQSKSGTLNQSVPRVGVVTRGSVSQCERACIAANGAKYHTCVSMSDSAKQVCAREALTSFGDCLDQC